MIRLSEFVSRTLYWVGYWFCNRYTVSLDSKYVRTPSGISILSTPCLAMVANQVENVVRLAVYRLKLYFLHS